MIQVSTVQVSYLQATFTGAGEPASGLKNPVSAFQDFLSGFMNSNSSNPGNPCCGCQSTAIAQPAGTPKASTISGALQSLTDGLASLINFVEKRLDQLRSQLDVDLPGRMELKQDPNASRIKICGASGKQKALEDSLNDDFLFSESFRSVRIQYAEFQGYSMNPASANDVFSITFKDGKAALNPEGLNEDLFTRLIEELDRIRDTKEEKETAPDSKMLV